MGKTSATAQIQVLDVYKKIVLHGMGANLWQLKQIHANATELSVSQVKATLAALETAGRVRKVGDRWEKLAVTYPCCKQVAGSDHSATCPQFPGAKALNAKPAPAKTISATQCNFTVEQMRIRVRQHPEFVKTKEFTAWIAKHQNELVTAQDAINKLKELVAAGPAMSDAQRTYEVKMLLAEPLRPFHLQGTDRVELIPPTMAKIRNRNRRDDNRWVEVPHNEKQLIEKAVVPGFLEYDRLSPAEKAERQQELRWQAAYEMAKEGNVRVTDAQPRPTKDTPAPAKTSAKVANTATGNPADGKRWLGMPMTTFMRHCAHSGMTKADLIDLVCNQLMMPASKTTINIQYGWGVKGLKLPTLTSAQADAFKELAKGYKLPAAVGKQAGKGKPAKAKK